MSSKRTRSLPRFSKTNLRKVLHAKSMRRSPAQKHSYESLEPRQLLTADIGINFTSANDGSGVSSNANPPNISAAVGENHVVQFLNSGFSIYEKDAGAALLQSGTLEDFYTAANNGVAPVDDDGNAVSFDTPRLVFDSGFDRWYVVAVDNQDLNDDLPLLQGNRIWIAASNTPDPTGSWKSGSIQLDTGTFDEDGNLVYLFGTERITMSMDEVGMSMSAQEFTFTLFGKTPVGSAVVGLPQVALFGGDIETGRQENIRGITNNPDDADGDGIPDGIGFEIQFGLDTTIDPQTFPVTSTQSFFGLAIDGEGDGDTFPTGRQGDELVLTEFTREGTPNVDLNLTQGESAVIPIDFYREPDVVRQPTDIIRDRDSTLFNASVAQEGDFLYAVHSVRAVVTLDDGTQAEGPNAVLRWYKVDTTPETDPDTGELIYLVDHGTIEAATNDIDYIDPSIDVSPNGTVAIGYTATGLNLFPSSYISIAVPSSGVDSPLAFNDPTELKAGASTYIDLANGGLPNHFWGRYTTTVNDPYDPNSFWTFQQYTDASNNWAIQATQVGATDTNPVIDVTPPDLDNIIEVNQVGDLIQVVVDGTIVGEYDSDGIGTLTVNGNGGMDQFIVNVPDLDAAEISGSYILVGDGDDKLQLDVSSDTVWQFDGGNGVNINSGRILADGMIEFRSGDGNDRFNIPTSNYDFPIYAGAGNDVFVVEQDVTGNLQLFGEAGDDIYNLPASSFAGTAISDSVGSENDQLTSTGTDGQDIIAVGETEITINGIVVPFDDASTAWGIETFAIDAYADDDTFNITSTTRGIGLFGQRGADVFNVAETTQQTGATSFMIDGGEDVNTLNVYQNDALVPGTVTAESARITNMSNVDVEFVATGGSFNENLFGSETRSDTFEVLSVAAGNDLKVYGRAMDDVFFFETLVDGTVELLGGAGDDGYGTNIVSIFDVVVTDSLDDETDLLYVRMTAGNDIIAVNESGYVFNGMAYPTANASFSGIEDFALDGFGGDDTFNVTRTTTVASLYGSAGDDIFNITDLSATTGTTELRIDGGTGNNEMYVSRSAIFGGAVAGTEIQIEDNRIVGMTTADIDYVATDGIFSLIELEGTMGATAGDDIYDDIFRVNTLGDQTLLRINSLGGNDLIDVAAAAAGDIEIDGGLDDDQFLVDLAGSVDRTVTVFDTGGVDRLDVFFSDAAETIDVIDTIGRLEYAIAGSSVNANPDLETLALHARGGDDRYTVTGTTTDNLILAGGAGDDTYDLANVFGDTMVSIIDSVDAENDRLTVEGTTGDDVFEINENSFLINGNTFMVSDPMNANVVGIESLEVNALDGDDTFIVNSATRGFALLGGDGNDHFMIHDTAADGGGNDLVIDAGTGANTMDIQRIAGTPDFAVIQDSYIANVAKSTIRYSATGGSFTGGNGGITIRGLDDVADSFLVFGVLAENSVELLGVGGNDYHRITTDVEGDVWMDGASGRDRYVFFLDEDKSRNLRVSDSGLDAEVDRINVFLGENSDNVVLDGPEVALINDTMSFLPSIETVEILAGDGDDQIDVRAFDGVSFLRIKGEDGNDTLAVNRANGVENVILIGEAGNDTFDLAAASQTGYLGASGNDGEDFFRVGEDFYRNANINGGNDDDRYDISFADRGQRNLAVADSGTGGNDTAIVRATDATTRTTFRASGINTQYQLVSTTRQLESLEFLGTEGRDIVTMFAVPVVNMSIDTMTGSDILNINSNNGAESLDIDLGAEKDVANIVSTAVGTTMTLDMGRDDDLVNIGSHLAADSGSLDALQGVLAISLGQGSDRLYLNDSQSAGAHGYTLTDSQVMNDAAVRARNFSGLSYSGAEFLQIRSNAQFNQFTVSPSDSVKFLLDGNLPQNNQLTVTGSGDGRELFMTDAFAGIWSFDSLREIQFEQFAV
ncbi:hypothetical protein [Mariniblastus fucicola]|uniref:Uncharacterized protein n=1 Tax=Mariniblastus fucicola TaxID=980251 RepID=A0A5B9PQ31_9BACT|nr:hypothetical protein [Mariniblastus fucicola]QEG24581.1 hypothetical protein MFFC18_45020 [Mariniblastus fucicola]